MVSIPSLKGEERIENCKKMIKVIGPCRSPKDRTLEKFRECPSELRVSIGFKLP